MEKKSKPILYTEYRIFLAVCLLFAVLAFVFDSPANIFSGLLRIFTSRALLITDYIYVGGFGATIINSTLVSLFAVFLVWRTGAKPNGAMIMCLWMSAGWTYFGANLINILPMTTGVWLYSKMKKRPFSEFLVPALLCNTITPIVSVFFFSNPIMENAGIAAPFIVDLAIGIGAGLLCGFILPMVATGTARMHDGFTLYNIGVAGGIIALFLTAAFASVGITVPTAFYRDTESTMEIAIFMYTVCAVLLLTGILTGITNKTNHIKNYKDMLKQTGRAPNDFYQLYGSTAYINMGLLGILGTTVVLGMGAYLDGTVVASIFTMIAFGTLGKHLRNVVPLVAGAIICAHIVTPYPLAAPDPTFLANVLAILLVSCLAPIAGTFGFFWGLVTGFVHVVTVHHTGILTNGFNLYNNGFASGFVALFLVPIILAIQRKKKTGG